VVGAFFTGDKGLFSRLDSQVKVYTQAGGILDGRKDSLDTTMGSVTKQREAHQRSMAALEKRLYAQYNAMDSLVAQLTNTGNSLLAGLDNLNASRSK